MPISYRYALLLSAACLVLTACGPSKKEVEAMAAASKLAREREQNLKDGQVANQFRALSDHQILQLLSDCRREVLAAAREKYKPFEPFMADEYSADRHQAQTHLSGGKIAKSGEMERRVKAFRASLNESKNGFIQNVLDTRFSVMVTRDTFNGPERMSIKATCEFDVGPKAVAVLDRGH